MDLRLRGGRDIKSARSESCSFELNKRMTVGDKNVRRGIFLEKLWNSPSTKVRESQKKRKRKKIRDRWRERETD